MDNRYPRLVEVPDLTVGPDPPLTRKGPGRRVTYLGSDAAETSYWLQGAHVLSSRGGRGAFVCRLASFNRLRASHARRAPRSKQGEALLLR